MAILIEIASSAFGALSGVLAVAFMIATYRSITRGRAAYEANRLVSKPSLWASLKGDMTGDSEKGGGRTNHGLAIELKTGRLVPQQRLGSDAVDDVIARRP